MTHSLDADGVGWIVFDDPAGRANVFNPATLAALRAAVAALAGSAAKAVVIASAKEKIFIAGADLKWLGRLDSPAAALQAAQDGQAAFTAVADLPVPVVAAIHGACAGGGFELALACRARVASDARETVIGLPEVGLGLIPGWGGCARLPRLVGAPAATDHILKAQLVPAAAALQAGMVDEVVPAAELRPRAKALALALASGAVPPRPPAAAADAGYFAAQRPQVAARMRGQPAPLAALDAIEQGLAVALPEALAIEAAKFASVAAGGVARNLQHVHALKEAGRRATVDAWFAPAAAGTAAVEPPRFVGVVGAGVMGTGIAQWCAAHGVGVMLSDADADALRRGVQVIRGLFEDMVKRGQMTGAAAHKAMGSIGITTDLRDFADCDLVIEAVVEDVAAKRKLLGELAAVVPPDCLLASNTSALPIEELTAGVREPGRTLGLHFFNPVGRMPLVELVLAPQTTRATAERGLAFVRLLGKTAVVCRSAPGFYVTRGLFFYLNAACALWEQGVPTETLDGAMRDWGWPMGPMRLVDEVGVDVTDFIFREMAHYFPGRFAATGICRRLLEAGLKGRKNGASAGFYAYDGVREAPNPAVARFASAARRDLTARAIQDHLNGVLVAETRRVLGEGVLKSPDDADLALLLGAGFPAWRGGLLRGAAPA
ncbi:MAG TPA: 3-hydroxyacyl-CoA dehydrogenase NAD-binding domain-containing protein [Opitutaceae bacterium]|nr:3-hydroxyacyl-CoA dehydrogenase NAD-binding domain-containing protein [Opitutaceae bacterium]